MVFIWKLDLKMSSKCMATFLRRVAAILGVNGLKKTPKCIYYLSFSFLINFLIAKLFLLLLLIVFLILKMWTKTKRFLTKSCQSKFETLKYFLFLNDWDIWLMHFERCKKCKSLLKPNVVLFNELLSHENVEKIDDELKTCDLFFIVRQIFGIGKIRKNRKKNLILNQIRFRWELPVSFIRQLAMANIWVVVRFRSLNSILKTNRHVQELSMYK